jgi:hypothetical protein
MKLLDQFVSKINKQPAEWTSQDIETYMEYVKTWVTEETDQKE